LTRPPTQLAGIVGSDLGVAAGYVHTPKLVVCGAPVERPGTILKCYVMHHESEPLPDEITRLARLHLATAPLEARGLGFVVLHRCEKNFYFLIAATWRHCNELWQTVYYKDGESMPLFELFPRDATHKPTWCVWELVPVWHEQQAWLRFLASARTVQAAQVWLDDVYLGAA
jgi:hypothetical protein